ncbi:MAG: leucine-rich repeat domain-containing protein [Lachnospiraceae bacterium]
MSNKSISMAAETGQQQASSSNMEDLTATYSNSIMLVNDLQPQDDNVYHTGDISVVNQIIQKNGLTAQKDNPESWGFVEWSDESPHRVISLSLSSKGLTGSLDVSGLTQLKILNCNNNKLSALNLGELTQLSALFCMDNQLRTLDVSKQTWLQHLFCINNQLTTLDVSGATNLIFLYCYNNQIRTLDVKNLVNLEQLGCSNNQLESLDVKSLMELNVFYCENNQLTQLDISGMYRMRNFGCGNNPLNKLITPTGQTLIIQTTGSGKVVIGLSDPNASSNDGYNVNTGEVTLTAVPVGGKFLNWSGDVSPDQNQDNPLSFILASDSNIKADFTTSTSGGGGGGGGSSKSSTSGSYTGNWLHDGNGWWYQYLNGGYPKNEWQLISGKRYYFDCWGYMATGWHYINNDWYWFDPVTGEMVANTWINDREQSYYLGSNGVMETGWIHVNERYYYLSEIDDSYLGHMLTNTTTPDGYYVDYDGSWLQ